jgi:hypothetical protein
MQRELEAAAQVMAHHNGTRMPMSEVYDNLQVLADSPRFIGYAMDINRFLDRWDEDETLVHELLCQFLAGARAGDAAKKIMCSRH